MTTTAEVAQKSGAAGALSGRVAGFGGAVFVAKSTTLLKITNGTFNGNVVPGGSGGAGGAGYSSIL